MYDKIFTHKLVEDIDDVRDYVESNMLTAAITRLNLIKRDIIKVSTLHENETKIRGKVIPIRKKTNR
jgi:hypothetical protein